MHGNFKRLLGVLLCLALLAGLSTAVFARQPALRDPEDEGYIMLEGVTLTEESLEHGYFEGRSISYDAAQKRLSIGEDLHGGEAPAMYSSVKGLTIYAAEDVTLDTEQGHAVCLEADTVFTGPGKLTVKAEPYEGTFAAVYVSGNASVTVENCNLELSGDYGFTTALSSGYPADGGGGLTFRNSSVHAVGTTAAVCGFDGCIWLVDCEIASPAGATVDSNLTGEYAIVGSDHAPVKEVQINPTGTVYHTVSFVMNGHGRPIDSIQVEDGEPANLPGDPSEEGWIFGGWYTDPACTQVYDLVAPVTEDLTLYAQWSEDNTGEVYSLWITGMAVADFNKDSIPGIAGGECFRYVPETKTLYVTDCETDGQTVIYSEIKGLTICVEKDTSLICNDGYAVVFCEDTTITGPGKLTIGGGSGESISLCTENGATLTLKDCDLEVSGGYAIAASESGSKLVIRNSTVHATGETGAIDGFTSGITLENCEISFPAGGVVEGSMISTGNGIAAKEVRIQPKPQAFTDVSSTEYYAEPVSWAVDQNITNGTGSGKFSPDATCTRGQVVTFLWRAKGCPEPASTENPFADVKESDYFYKAVLWAKENNVTSGTSADRFSPDKPCTRAQVVTFLYRAEATFPLPSGGDNELPIIPIGSKQPCPFNDVQSGVYYYDAVLWAVAQGITTGTSATSFSPDKTCTRGQIVTFLYRDMAE